jgi:MYXO-CTERM domain-containing protein
MRALIKVGLSAAAMLCSAAAGAAPIYVDGVSPAASASGLTFGTHLTTGPHTSVPGVGGSGLNSAAGSVLDGARTYIYDQGAQADLTDGVAQRGVDPFAMMIWDMGTALNSLRLYTHQDHYAGGPVTTNFVGQDLMEYSVWGSHDGDNFVLLSDVLGFDLNGGGAGKPTYTFSGTEPTIVYRGGSTEHGIVNAYTREYVFGTSYRYYGIRTSQVSLTIPGGGIDADPEIDAIAAFSAADRCTIDPLDPSCRPGTTPVDEPGTAMLLGLGALGLIRILRRRRTG